MAAEAGPRQGKKRKTPVVERPVALYDERVLQGLDRDHHNIVGDDARIVELHQQAISTNLQKWMKHELDLCDVRPSSNKLAYLPGRRPMAMSFGPPAKDDTQLAQQLLGLKHMNRDPLLQAGENGFVTYALDWLVSFGVVGAAKAQSIVSNMLGDMAAISTAHLYLHWLLDFHFDHVRQITIELMAQVIDPHLPITVIEEIVEYMIPNRPIIQSYSERMRRMIYLIAFPVQHAYVESRTLLHTQCMEHYLRYRRVCAQALDVVLQQHHATSETALKIMESGTLLGRSQKKSKRKNVCNDGYCYMIYCLHDFKRVGRHAWMATLVSTEIRAFSDGGEKVDAPRLVRLRQTELPHRPWALTCYSPAMVVSLELHCTSPPPPTMDYWQYISTHKIGLCAAENHKMPYLDVTYILDRK